MPINYTIHADVVDISADRPRPEDAFLVDSNVWLWMTYSKAGHRAQPWQAGVVPSYSGYVNAAANINAKVHWCGLSLAELAHVIEKTEREIYEASHSGIKTKEYRHNCPTERANVVSEVETAWGQVKSLAAPMAASINEPTSDAALNRFKTQLVDGYDLFILEAMTANGVAQIITDDGDFATVPGIQVFTANRNVIAAASSQDRLIAR
jgi:predicted nucleic acid-binding protein